ncbi:MAG: phosphopantetheine adenylyltransferase [Planctomycetes bacterium DG_23]|nr:MAG: phosphopantetheine adenylyltransferase [Planctomycetes bacterium DG_23]
MRTAVYPGTFDPITYGHLDVIGRGSKIFDELVVAVAESLPPIGPKGPAKETLFTVEERLEMIKELTGEFENVRVEHFSGLVVDYVRKKKTNVLLRGIRTVSDFEYEFQMALTNRTFAPEVETVFVMASQDYSFLSSRLIKEAASLGANLSSFVPPEVERRLKEKLKWLG